MNTEQIAQIIASGEVPLSVRMSQSDDDNLALEAALDARESGRFDGMSYEQVLAQLQQNRAEAEADAD